MKDQQVMTIPFINFDENNNIHLTLDAANFLTNIPDEELIGIMIVIGKQRTGKSYFINECIVQHQDFKVSGTINGCTKGLQLLKRIIKAKNPNYNNLSFIVLDSEGLSNPNSSIGSDSKVFLVSLLISSLIIFNSMNVIDEQSLQELQVMLNLAKDIDQKNNIENTFPKFVWLVRDFALQLQNDNCQKIKSKQYLEKALEESKGLGDIVESKNKLRRQFKYFFKERECYTLIRPVEDESQLQNLDQCDDSQLRQEFLRQIQTIRSKLFKQITPKQINNKQMNGKMLVSLIQDYCHHINQGRIPNIQASLDQIYKEQGKKLFEIQLETYFSQTNILLQEISQDITIDFKEKLKKYNNIESLKQMLLQFSLDHKPYVIELQNEIQKKKEKTKQESLKMINKYFEQKTDAQYKNIITLLENNQIKTHEEFHEKLDNFRNNFYIEQCHDIQMQDQFFDQKQKHLFQLFSTQFDKIESQLLQTQLKKQLETYKNYQIQNEQTIDDQKFEIQQLQEYIFELQQKEQSIIQDKRNFDKEIKQIRLSTSNIVKNQEVSSLNQFQHEAELKDLKETISIRDARINLMRNENLQLKKNIFNLEEREKESQNLNYELNQKIEEVSLENSQLCCQVKNLEDFQNFTQGLSEQGILFLLDQIILSKEHSKQLQILQQDIEELKDQLSITKTRDVMLENKNEQLIKENNKLKTQIIGLNSQIQVDNNKDFKKLTEQLMEKERNGFQNDIKFLQKNTEDIKIQYNQLKSENQNLYNKNDTLTDELQEQQNLNIQQLEQISLLQRKIQENVQSQVGEQTLQDKYEQIQNHKKSQHYFDLQSYLETQDKNFALIVEHIKNNSFLQEQIIEKYINNSENSIGSHYHENQLKDIKQQIENLKTNNDAFIQRNNYLEVKFLSYKQLKQNLKQCKQFFCAQTGKNIEPSQFKEHFKNLKIKSLETIQSEIVDNDSNNPSNSEISTNQISEICTQDQSIKIIKVESLENDKYFGNTYLIKVSQGGVEYQVNKTNSQLLELRNAIVLQIKGVKLPDSVRILENINKKLSGKINQHIDQNLLNFLQDLTKQDLIRESSIFINFLGLIQDKKQNSNIEQRKESENESKSFKLRKQTQSAVQSNKNVQDVTIPYVKKFQNNHQYNDKEYEQKSLIKKQQKKDMYGLPSDEVSGSNTNKKLIQQKIENKIDRIKEQKINKP